MASPFNPFAGRGQKTGATGAAGRGRGASRGPSTFQPRGSSAPRANFRGRGRGTGARGSRGRGVGAVGGTTNASYTAPEASNPGLVNSPFAQLNHQTQLNQQKSFSAIFGGQAAQQKSPFSGIDNGAPAQPRQPPATNFGAGPDAPVPVEDTSILNRYHERYEQLKIDRAKERQKAIKEGQMADPNQPTSLNQAITPVGTCTSMCPEFERVERIVQKMVDKSEKFLHPSTDSLQNMETKMLKRFRRSAAGYDEQLPSDIRTPKALLQTTNYLIRHVINGNESLGLIHKFVWDRTRSVRNDFSVQQLTQENDVRMAVTCLERIARFHIVSLHLLSSPANEEPFDRHQEREQLNNTMLSLMYYYDDNRGRISFPNEDEFRAYYIIFSIHDQRPDLEARVQKWPVALLNAPRVQVALEIFAACCNTWEYQGALDARRPNAIAQGFYTRFFNIINSPSVSYLMACVAEIYFNYIRQTAIRAIWKAYCRSPASQQHKNEEWTVDELTRVLHFDDNEQTISFCEEQDLQLAENANGDLYLNWGNRPVDSVGFQPSSEHSFSGKYVESKRAGRTLDAVILGLNIREAAKMGMIDRSELPARTKQVAPEVPLQDDSLFVSQDDNQVPTSVTEAAKPFAEPARAQSPFFASGLRTASEDAAQLPPANQPFNALLNPPVSQPSNPFQSSGPPAMFSTPFSGGTATNIPPATSTATPNPFAALSSGTASAFAPSSPFTPLNTAGISKKDETPAVTSISSQPSVFVGQSPSPFAGQSSTLGGNGATTTTPGPAIAPSNPFASSISSFTTPKAPEPNPKAGTPSTTTTSTPQPSSLFPTAKPFFPSSEQKETSATKTTLSSTSPFSFPSASTFHPTPNLSAPPATNVTQQSASIFESAKPPAFTGFSQPSLFQSQKAPAQETNTPVASPPQPAQPVSEPKPAPKLFDSASTGPSPFAATFQPSKPLFPTPNTPVAPAAKPETKQPEQSFEDATNQVEKSAATAPVATHPQAPLPSKTMVTESVAKKADGGQVQSTIVQSAITAGPEDKEKPTAYPPLISPEVEAEHRRVWESFLGRLETRERAAAEKKAAAERQARAHQQAAMQPQAPPATRKRVYSEPLGPEHTAKGTGPKAPKVSDEKELPKKFSLAEASIKPLPKLPILERLEKKLEEVKTLTQPRPPTLEETEAEKRRLRQVDEDEMLLNAARIATEQLRSGPKLSDLFPGYTPPRLSSYNPSRSVSYSPSYTPSMSPPVPSHGYRVAYAPDTPLGLGRTMSRTEERIRRTGAHGLAYIPLKFPLKKEDKKKDEETDKDDEKEKDKLSRSA